METRKMQKVGGGTFTVSIPKEWATEQGIEAGTTVHLYTHADGSILVRGSPRDGDGLATATLELGGDAPERVARTLRAAHDVGFETVTLVPGTAFAEPAREAVAPVVRNLVGAELRTREDDEIAVRNLLDASEVSARQSVVQLSFSARSVHRRATEAFVEADGSVRGQLDERRDEVSRLATVLARHHNRSLLSLAELDRLGVSRAALYDCHVVARQLERVAELGVEIAGFADRLAEPLPAGPAAELERIAEAARGLVDDAVTAVLDEGTVDGANDLLDRRDVLAADLDALEADALGDSSAYEAPLARAVDALRRTVDRGGAIADAALRAAVRAECL